MKKAKWVYYLFFVTGIFLLLACITACEKTEYDLLDPESAGVWEQYKSGGSGIPGNLVWDIEPENDKLWISFLGKGVGVYSNDSWTIYNESNSGIMSNYITDLELTPDGDMLMGTVDGLCMRTATGSWLYFQDASVSSMEVNAVKYTSSGDTWIGTDGEGFYVDFGAGFYHYKFSGFENINAIEEDSDGDVWLGTDNGLMEYNGSSLSLMFTSDNGLPDDEVSALFLDRQNKLWVGTNGGVTVSWISTSNRMYQLSLRDSDAGNYIRDIYQDRKGDVWFATWFDGLIRYDGVVPHSFKEYNDFYEDDVNCIQEDTKGNLWFGLYTEGLIKYSLPLE